MKHGKVIAGILAILGAIIAFIFGKRSGVLDNRGRASTIGNGLDDSTKRASIIESETKRARDSAIESRDTVRQASQSNGRAIDAINNGIGIIQKIRARGIVKKVDPTD